MPGRNGIFRSPSKLSLLSETEIFRELSVRDLAEVERIAAMRTCRRGTVLYTPGETGEVLFVLKTGRVNLFRISPNGKKLTVGSVNPGTLFGEMSLVGQGMHQTFAEAAEECTLCVMSRREIEHLLVSKPLIMLQFLKLVARRLSDIERRLEQVAFKGVPARLATELLRLGESEGRVDGMSHQELAEAVGSYRETVTRVLNGFKRAGLVGIDRRSVEIKDMEGLRAVAES